MFSFSIKKKYIKNLKTAFKYFSSVYSVNNIIAFNNSNFVIDLSCRNNKSNIKQTNINNKKFEEDINKKNKKLINKNKKNKEKQKVNLKKDNITNKKRSNNLIKLNIEGLFDKSNKKDINEKDKKLINKKKNRKEKQKVNLKKDKNTNKKKSNNSIKLNIDSLENSKIILSGKSTLIRPNMYYERDIDEDKNKESEKNLFANSKIDTKNIINYNSNQTLNEFYNNNRSIFNNNFNNNNNSIFNNNNGLILNNNSNNNNNSILNNNNGLILNNNLNNNNNLILNNNFKPIFNNNILEKKGNKSHSYDENKVKINNLKGNSSYNSIARCFCCIKNHYINRINSILDLITIYLDKNKDENLNLIKFENIKNSKNIDEDSSNKNIYIVPFGRIAKGRYTKEKFNKLEDFTLKDFYEGDFMSKPPKNITRNQSEKSKENINNIEKFIKASDKEEYKNYDYFEKLSELYNSDIFKKYFDEEKLAQINSITHKLFYPLNYNIKDENINKELFNLLINELKLLTQKGCFINYINENSSKKNFIYQFLHSDQKSNKYDEFYLGDDELIKHAKRNKTHKKQK